MHVFTGWESAVRSWEESPGTVWVCTVLVFVVIYTLYMYLTGQRYTFIFSMCGYCIFVPFLYTLDFHFLWDYFYITYNRSRMQFQEYKHDIRYWFYMFFLLVVTNQTRQQIKEEADEIDFLCSLNAEMLLFIIINICFLINRKVLLFVVFMILHWKVWLVNFYLV